jgi:hypothetical protein
LPESSLSRNIEDSKLTTFKKMSKISLTWNPGKVSIERRINKLIKENLVSYNHKTDNCFYFILFNELYGYRKMKLPLVTTEVNIFWKDDCNFQIDQSNTLIKSPSDDFKIIDSYLELKKLFDLIRLCKH